MTRHKQVESTHYSPDRRANAATRLTAACALVLRQQPCYDPDEQLPAEAVPAGVRSAAELDPSASVDCSDPIRSDRISFTVSGKGALALFLAVFFWKLCARLNDRDRRAARLCTAFSEQARPHTKRVRGALAVVARKVWTLPLCLSASDSLRRSAACLAVCMPWSSVLDRMPVCAHSFERQARHHVGSVEMDMDMQLTSPCLSTQQRRRV
jgi:hypothetical protein